MEIHSFEHYRDCPALREKWNQLVDIINAGDEQFGYEVRNSRSSQYRREAVERDLKFAEAGTEDCKGIVVTAEGDNVSIYCPGKQRVFSYDELIRLGYPVQLLISEVGPNS